MVEHCVVLGVSAGGMRALDKLLPKLEPGFSFPLVIVQHLHPTQGDYLFDYYNEQCSYLIKEAEDKESLLPGVVYFAPANYHLLIDEDHTLTLSTDEKIRFSRPSIDVLFESAVGACFPCLTAVLLTGANNDGTIGMQKVKNAGGRTMAQSPETAEFSIMPQSAIKAGVINHVLSLEEIAEVLKSI